MLARDGFIAPRWVSVVGDLGADIIAIDHAGLTVVIKCKQLRRPVSCVAVQQFNGTARPEYGAHHAIIIGLNGFTNPCETSPKDMTSSPSAARTSRDGPRHTPLRRHQRRQRTLTQSKCASISQVRWSPNGPRK
ncbi:restriction endonuclease [Streptomyces rhizosphaericola]|uniref:restriction endonuclease n=1 Tax=Streptomyces rhizosphaericola TaxID=2564098 RepID=UPI0039F05959